MREIVVDHRRIVLCHYALQSWRRIHGGAVHLYGHTHVRIPGTRHSEDAGVDAWGYAPVAFHDLLMRMADNPTLEDELRLAPERVTRRGFSHGTARPYSGSYDFAETS